MARYESKVLLEEGVRGLGFLNHAFVSGLVVPFRDPAMGCRVCPDFPSGLEQFGGVIPGHERFLDHTLGKGTDLDGTSFRGGFEAVGDGEAGCAEIEMLENREGDRDGIEPSVVEMDDDRAGRQGRAVDDPVENA